MKLRNTFQNSGSRILKAFHFDGFESQGWIRASCKATSWICCFFRSWEPSLRNPVSVFIEGNLKLLQEILRVRNFVEQRERGFAILEDHYVELATWAVDVIGLASILGGFYEENCRKGHRMSRIRRDLRNHSTYLSKTDASSKTNPNDASHQWRCREFNRNQFRGSQLSRFNQLIGIL